MASGLRQWLGAIIVALIAATAIVALVFASISFNNLGDKASAHEVEKLRENYRATRKLVNQQSIQIANMNETIQILVQQQATINASLACLQCRGTTLVAVADAEVDGALTVFGTQCIGAGCVGSRRRMLQQSGSVLVVLGDLGLSGALKALGAASSIAGQLDLDTIELMNEIFAPNMSSTYPMSATLLNVSQTVALINQRISNITNPTNITCCTAGSNSSWLGPWQGTILYSGNQTVTYQDMIYQSKSVSFNDAPPGTTWTLLGGSQGPTNFAFTTADFVSGELMTVSVTTTIPFLGPQYFMTEFGFVYYTVMVAWIPTLGYVDIEQIVDSTTLSLRSLYSARTPNDGTTIPAGTLVSVQVDAAPNYGGALSSCQYFGYGILTNDYTSIDIYVETDDDDFAGVGNFYMRSLTASFPTVDCSAAGSNCLLCAEPPSKFNATLLEVTPGLIHVEYSVTLGYCRGNNTIPPTAMMMVGNVGNLFRNPLGCQSTASMVGSAGITGYITLACSSQMMVRSSVYADGASIGLVAYINAPYENQLDNSCGLCRNDPVDTLCVTPSIGSFSIAPVN